MEICELLKKFKELVEIEEYMCNIINSNNLECVAKDMLENDSDLSDFQRNKLSVVLRISEDRYAASREVANQLINMLVTELGKDIIDLIIKLNTVSNKTLNYIDECESLEDDPNLFKINNGVRICRSIRDELELLYPNWNPYIKTKNRLECAKIYVAECKLFSDDLVEAFSRANI